MRRFKPAGRALRAGARVGRAVARGHGSSVGGVDDDGRGRGAPPSPPSPARDGPGRAPEVFDGPWIPCGKPAGIPAAPFGRRIGGSPLHTQAAPCPAAAWRKEP